MDTIDPRDSYPQDDERPTPGDSAPDAGVEVEALRRQRDENHEQYLRCMADFSNFQKRSRAQAEVERQYAAGPLALDLLGVIDNFSRAIEAARATGPAPIVNGLEMMHRQLLEALAKHGVEPITAVGEPFDPTYHEALVQQPDPEAPEGTVLAELESGYRIRERVLRPSRVIVSTRPG